MKTIHRQRLFRLAFYIVIAMCLMDVVYARIALDVPVVSNPTFQTGLLFAIFLGVWELRQQIRPSTTNKE